MRRRWVKLLVAAFALGSLPLLVTMGIEVESDWWGFGYGVGTGALALTAVHLIVSVAVASAVEQIVAARPSLVVSPPKLNPEQAAEHDAAVVALLKKYGRRGAR